MGLWIQNVGVRARSLPPTLRARADADGDWLPETEGWSWTTVASEDGLEEDELDALVARAGSEAGAPALGFAIYDSDIAYVVGADGSGVRFHLVLGERAYEGAVAQEHDAAAAWALEHADAAVSQFGLGVPGFEPAADLLVAAYTVARDGDVSVLHVSMSGAEGLLRVLAYLRYDIGELREVPAEHAQTLRKVRDWLLGSDAPGEL